MKGYDEQYNCLVKFNVTTDLNSSKMVAERNRTLRYLRDMMISKAERNGGLADENMIESNREFIETFCEDNMFEIEEDAVDYLSKTYKDKRHAKLRKRLEFMLNKEYEYSHLKDLAVALMPTNYFKLDLYNRYADLGATIRDNYLNMKSLIAYLDIAEASFRMILKLDYALNAYLQENFRMNVKEVETTLFSKAIEERDFKAISYVLSNLYSERYKGQYSADLNVTRSEADVALDDMNEEDLAVMFANLTRALEDADIDSEDL